MRSSHLFLLLAIATLANAQTLKGPQSAPGYTFTIPEGWVGQTSEGSYVLVSENVAGLLMLVPNDYRDVAAMRADLSAPTEGEGTSMRVTEGPLEMGVSTLGVTQEGTMENTEAKAVAIATWNASGGKTVNVACIAPTIVFSEELLRALKEVHASVRYSDAGTSAPMRTSDPAPTAPAPKPITGPVDAYWTQRLGGNSLRYLDSYSSPAATPGDIGGGYSITRRMDLCPQGFFTTSGSSDHNFSGEDVSAYGSSQSAGEGRWIATQDDQGRPVLRLSFNEGGERNYLLENRGGLTYLNGEKWHRVNAERDGPDYAVNCP